MTDPAMVDDPPRATRRVVVADDRRWTRRALRRIVDHLPKLVVVGEAADGEQAVAMCIELRPDLVLMDVEMPRMTGIEATRQLSRRAPSVKVIALSDRSVASHVLPMIRAGASGYLLKGLSRQELIVAIEAVLEKGVFAISPSLTWLLAEHAANLREPPEEVVMPAGQVFLTQREIEVISWLARGLTNREIAERMLLSESSIKTYFNHISTKLAVTDRVQVLIRCYELGLVNPSLGTAGPSAEAPSVRTKMH